MKKTPISPRTCVYTYPRKHQTTKFKLQIGRFLYTRIYQRVQKGWSQNARSGFQYRICRRISALCWRSGYTNIRVPERLWITHRSFWGISSSRGFWAIARGGYGFLHYTTSRARQYDGLSISGQSRCGYSFVKINLHRFTRKHVYIYRRGQSKALFSLIAQRFQTYISAKLSRAEKNLSAVYPRGELSYQLYIYRDKRKVGYIAIENTNPSWSAR